MRLQGVDVPKRGTLSDLAHITAWYRRENMRLFEAMVNIYTAASERNPNLVGKLQEVMDSYTDAILPGSTEAKKESAANMIEQQAQMLDQIAEEWSKWEGE